jgi:hypothetical protein
MAVGRAADNPRLRAEQGPERNDEGTGSERHSHGDLQD